MQALATTVVAANATARAAMPMVACLRVGPAALAALVRVALRAAGITTAIAHRLPATVVRRRRTMAMATVTATRCLTRLRCRHATTPSTLALLLLQTKPPPRRATTPSAPVSALLSRPRFKPSATRPRLSARALPVSSAPACSRAAPLGSIALQLVLTAAPLARSALSRKSVG